MNSKSKFQIRLDNDNYKKAMETIIQTFLSDNWFIISKEPADNGIPVFVFQQDAVNILVSGAMNGNRGGITAIVTAENKRDLAAAKKVADRALAKLK